MRNKLDEIINKWDKSEPLVDHLLRCGVTVPLCNIGDAVYVVIDESDEEVFIEENKVTEISTKGIWVSGFFPPEDDACTLFEYDEIGKTIFFNRADAKNEKERRVRENELV